MRVPTRAADPKGLSRDRPKGLSNANERAKKKRRRKGWYSDCGKDAPAAATVAAVEPAAVEAGIDGAAGAGGSSGSAKAHWLARVRGQVH